MASDRPFRRNGSSSRRTPAGDFDSTDQAPSSTSTSAIDRSTPKGAPTAVVANESFVARFTADRDPVGRRIFIGSREATIVGVVPDLMSGDVDSIEQDGLYASIHQVRPYAVRVLATGPAGSPSLVRPPSGCRFHPRCPHFMEGLCDVEVPPDFEPESEHFSKCWLYKPQ